MNTYERNYKIAVTGALAALTVILGFTGLGYIRINPAVNYTILHIPTILAAILAGPFYGAAVGFCFGLTSLIQSAINPTSILAPFIVNPLVSVVPRMLIGIVAGFSFKALSSIPFTQKAKNALSLPFGIICAYLGSFSNTVFFFGSIFLIYAKKFTEAMGGKTVLVVALGAVPAVAVEATIAAVLVALVLSGLGIARSKKRSKLSEESETEGAEE